jgi:PAS domain S-box-containing protein
MLGIAVDITERIRAEKELTRVRLYLQNIIDSMPSVLVGVNPEGRITEFNKPAEQMSGIRREDANGNFFADVFPEFALQMEQVRAAIHQAKPIKTPRMTMKLQGETHYADVMVYPLITKGPIGAVIRVDDVTQRVRIENMMVQTEKMLSLGGLAAGMAHEINNPLGIILQGSQNVLRRLSPAIPHNHQAAEKLGLTLEQINSYLEERCIRQFVEDIQEAGARAADIISDMLAFSRRGDQRFTPVNMDEVLDRVIRLAGSDYDLKKRYHFKRIQIQRSYDHDLGPVPCDRTEIEQVLLNLVKNSAQAMAEANTTAPLITLHSWQEKNQACIEVVDNGPGMDEETCKRVFDPFFTTKEIGQGTGLGLSVSYFIVTEQHKGTLSVDSRPNQGARFTLRLPLQHAMAEKATAAI